jgi:hypothetical protein
MKRKILVACATTFLALFICSWPWSNGVGRSEDERTNHNYNESQVAARAPTQTTESANDELDSSVKPESSSIQKIPTSLRERAALYEPLFRSAAVRYGIDARLLWVIAFLETRFQPDLVSPVGARGLMQFMPATAASYGLKNPDNPAESIDAAARYVRDLQARFGNRFDLILASYNAGEGAVDAYLKGYVLKLSNGRVINPSGLKLGGIPPYAETRNYVAQGLAIARMLGAGNFNPANLVVNSPTSTNVALNSQATPQVTPKSRHKTSVYAASSKTVTVPTKPLSEVTDTDHHSFRASEAPERQRK